MSAVITFKDTSLQLRGDRTLKRDLYITAASFPFVGAVLTVGKRRAAIAFAGDDFKNCSIRGNQLWIGNANFDLCASEVARVQELLGLAAK